MNGRVIYAFLYAIHGHFSLAIRNAFKAYMAFDDNKCCLSFLEFHYCNVTRELATGII